MAAQVLSLLPLMHYQTQLLSHPTPTARWKLTPKKQLQTWKLVVQAHTAYGLALLFQKLMNRNSAAANNFRPFCYFKPQIYNSDLQS